jgi:uncharacterized protein YqgC (DUF456 family)
METAALIVTILLFLVGLAGAVLPVLPGTIIAWLGLLVHKLWMGGQSVPWWYVLAVGLGIVALTYLADAVFTWWGARRFGASWRGALGALVGGVVGLVFFGPLGIILGPIVGAVLVEWWHHKDHEKALRAGWGAFLGGLASMAVKLALTLVLIVGFFIYLPPDAHPELWSNDDGSPPAETLP